MGQHVLQGRTEDEVTWYQRRSFLSAAAAWTAMGGYSAAQAQQRSNVVEMVGDVMVNGLRLQNQGLIQAGDALSTGPGSNLVFVIGNASFQVRQNTRFIVERGASANIVSVLRIITGGIASVWGKGTDRRIITPTLTAGIRGTGVYNEVLQEQDYRSYFCNCYGVVDLQSGTDSTVSQADYHQSFWAEATSKDGRFLRPAQPINHTDLELEVLARLIDQRTSWQISGKKGSRDGNGTY